MVTAGRSGVDDLAEHLPAVGADALLEVVLDFRDGTLDLISDDVRRARLTPSKLERRLLGGTHLDHPTKWPAGPHSSVPDESTGWVPEGIANVLCRRRGGFRCGAVRP